MNEVPIQLAYGVLKRPAHSLWSIFGFALAVLAAIPSVMAWRGIIRTVEISGSSVSYRVGRLYYAEPILAIMLCIVGARRGAKLFAIAGMVIAAAALVAITVAWQGSPWK